MSTGSEHFAHIPVEHLRRVGGRLFAAAVAASAASLFTIDVASAHVTVQPQQAPPDSSQIFNVRVPTEKEEATIRVRVEFPAGLTVSRFQPKPGWTREVQLNSQGQITAVTWSGGKVEPGEFDEFTFQARTPKEAGSLSFKAYQTYAGGETAEWVGAEGSERPAAMVAIRGASAGQSADSHGEGATGTQAAAKTASAPSAGAEGQARAPAADGGSDLPLFAALATGVLAVIALVLSGIALTRRPRAA